MTVRITEQVSTATYRDRALAAARRGAGGGACRPHAARFASAPRNMSGVGDARGRARQCAWPTGSARGSRPVNEQTEAVITDPQGAAQHVPDVACGMEHGTLSIVKRIKLALAALVTGLGHRLHEPTDMASIPAERRTRSFMPDLASDLQT